MSSGMNQQLLFNDPDSIRWQHLLRFGTWPVFSETGETLTLQHRSIKLILNCSEEKCHKSLFFYPGLLS